MEEKIINLIILIPLVCICFSKYIIILYKQKHYIKIKGKVVSTEKTHISGSLRKCAHNRYKFEYDNQNYDIEDKFYGGNPKLKTGDDVYMYISKEDHNKKLLPEEIYNKKTYFFGFVFLTLITFLVIID